MNGSDQTVFSVGDMTCSHCRETVQGALTAALPGQAFSVELGTQRVTVPQGAAARAEAAIRDAGYEPVRVG